MFETACSIYFQLLENIIFTYNPAYTHHTDNIHHVNRTSLIRKNLKMTYTGRNMILKCIYYYCYNYYIYIIITLLLKIIQHRVCTLGEYVLCVCVRITRP